MTRGSVIFPVSADAAHVAGEARYTSDFGEPMRPDVVAIRRRDRAFAVAERAHVSAETRAAPGRVHGAARGRERRENAFLRRLHPDFLRAGIDDDPQVRRDLLSLENLRYDAKVFDVAVSARPDEDLVDRDIVARDLRDRMDVVRRMGTSDLRFQRIDVDLQNPLVRPRRHRRVRE